MTTHNLEPIGRVLRLSDLVSHKKNGRIRMGKLGIGKTKLYGMIAAGTFPKPVRLGPNSVGWIEREVDAWLQSRPRG
jgi:predicted DNA-binding transcriptional regulator AlpA